MHKFLIVDDHQVVRRGVRDILKATFSPCDVTEAANGEAALQEVRNASFDLIIMDINMPDTDTLHLVEQVLKLRAGTRILMFSMGAEYVYAKRFLKAGARGFVSKDAEVEEIVKAVRQVLNNKRYVSDNLASVLANESLSGGTANPFNKLSAREFEIATLLLAGHTISGIAKSHNLKVSTIGTHKTRLFEKLGVTNLLELKELANNYQL
jgi:two-component system invasion response regulator UvrY